MIIDNHSHIRITDDIEESKNNIQEYRNNMRDCGIDKAIVTIDPFIDLIKCKKDPTHFVKMKSYENGNLICKCTACQEITYSGFDPFIKYNKYLYELTENMDELTVFPVVGVTPGTTQNMIDYYTDLYGSKLKGFKCYTGLSAYSLDELKTLRSNMPLLVHCGTFKNQDPAYMIEFAKKYQGILILAHLGGLNTDALSILNKMDNVMVDVSPAQYIFDTYIKNNRSGGIYNKDRIKTLDDMYSLLLECVNIDKILWGSDTPYSTQSKELKAFKESTIFSENEKEKILARNASRLFL